MEKKNIDWANLGFGYHETDQRFVSNYKNGSWDEGTSPPMTRSLSASVQVFFSMHRPASKE